MVQDPRYLGQVGAEEKEKLVTLAVAVGMCP